MKTVDDVTNLQNVWPPGSYGVMTTSVCKSSPNNTLIPGFIFRKAVVTQASNALGASLIIEDDYYREDICIHESEENAEPFPPGRYCIYRYNNCSSGFTTAEIYLEDQMMDISLQQTTLINGMLEIIAKIRAE